MVADIIVFNPETVTENSDYAAGKIRLPTTGCSKPGIPIETYTWHWITRT